MERLTDRCWKNLDPWETCGQDSYCKRGCHEEGGCTKGCIVPKLYSRLAKYEDLDEQCLLLRLPTEAYFIKDNKMYKGWVQEVVYSVCRKILLDIRYDDKTLDSYRGYIGNTVFLTQAEAEQRLKEMESK